MNSFLKKINIPLYKHILFWIVVFLFYSTSAKDRFDTIEEVVVTYFFHVVFQIIVAYSILYFITPNYHKNKSALEVILWLTILFFSVNFLYIFIRMSFLEPSYPNCYKSFLEKNGHLTFVQRIVDWKHIFITLPVFYLQPLFFLVALQFYEKQQKLSQINEQKKDIELKALKHQLNPHFLFNTLNNLYLLTVEKSDKAPEVIEKLSSILDYMLYGTDEKFVAIDKETELIENYLALQQIRYEDRVSITFRNSITKNIKIAPLLLLTFIENAFKHGVKHELGIAKVVISLTNDKNHIIFTILNSIPLIEKVSSNSKKSIGLKNIEQQLYLLYPNAYKLIIEENENSFFVTLKLRKH